MKLGCLIPVLLVTFITRPSTAEEPTMPRTRVVLLGTGTPLPDPERAGPSVAVVVGDTPYLVNAGTGLVRRAAAAREKGIEALRPVNLNIAFLTHLYSDHTLGLPDLIITPWIMGRKGALEGTARQGHRNGAPYSRGL